MSQSIGSLFLELGLDSTSYQQKMQEAHRMTQQTGLQMQSSLNLKLQIDTRGLQTLSDSAKYAQRSVQTVLDNISKPKIHLVATTDDRKLTELNKHLNLKDQHVKQIQRSWDTNPLTPKTDLSYLKAAQSQVASFRKDVQGLNDDLAKIKSSLNQTFKLAIDDSDLRKIEERISNIKAQKIKVDASISEPKERSPKPKEQVIKVRQDTSLLGGLKTGFIEGIGQSFALRVGSGMVAGVEKNLGINLKKIGDRFGVRYSELARNISENFVKSIGLSDGSKALTSEFNNVLKKWEALSEVSATAIGTTLKQAITGNFAEAKKEIIALSKEIAALGIDSGFAPVRVRKREVAKGAAKEVLNRQGSINVDRNEAIDKAQSITIATGGLNFSPGGKENTNFIRDLLKPVLPNSYIVGVNNPTTNDPKGFATQFDDFVKKLFAGLGRDLGDLDVKNIGKLAEMAIVKGINPDAITMAATAYAYKQAYPEKGINLVGTSGGGHVAADAVHLLEQLGMDTKGLGITTPFAGLANITNPKKFRAQIGTADPLYQRMFGMGIFKPGDVQDVYPGVGLGHLLPKFLAEESVQKDIQSFLGDRIGAINPDVTGKIGYSNMLGFYTKKASDSGNIRDAIAQSQGMQGESWFYKPDESFSRLQDLQGYIGAIRDVSKKAKGTVKQEAEDYVQFLEEFYAELEKHFASDRQYLPDLSKAKQYYPEAVKEQPERAIYTDKSMNAALQDYRYRGKTQSEIGNFRRSLSAMRGESVDGYSYFQKESGTQDQIQGLSSYLNDLAKNASGGQGAIVQSQKKFVSSLAKLIAQYHEVGLDPNSWEIDNLESQLNELESALKQPFNPKLDIDQVAIAKAKIEKSTTELASRTKSAFTKVAEVASGAANSSGLALLNNKIASIDAFKDEAGGTPKVARFGDLSLRGYAEIAKQDTASLFKFLQGTIGKGYGAMKGIEDAAFSVLPFARPVKSAVQQVAYPMIAFNALSHGMPMLAGAAHETVGGLVHLGAGGLENAATNAIGGAFQSGMQSVGTSQGVHLPNLLHKLPGAPELEAVVNDTVAARVQAALNASSTSLQAMTTSAIEGAAEVITNALTPIVGGKAALAPVEAVGKQIVGDQSQIIAATQQKMGLLKAGIEEAKKRLSARPEDTQLYVRGIDREMKQIGAEINQGISTLAPLQRMSSTEGAQLAQLKGQVTQQEKKLNQLVNGLKEMFAHPQQTMRSSVQGDIIDAEIIDVTPMKSAMPLPSSKDMFEQAQKNAIAQLKKLKQVFAEQTKFANSGSPESAAVASELQAAIAQSRKEIDSVMSAIGKNASKPLKEAARQARAQITRTETTVNKSGVQKDGNEIGSNVASGLNAGLVQGIAGVQSAAEKLARAAISGAEDELEIKSPSRVFIRIGQMAVAGLEKGLDAIGQMGAGQQLSPVVQEIKDILSGLAPEAAKVAGLVQKAFSMIPAPIRGAIGAFLGFQAVSFVLPFLADFANQSVQTALDVQTLERSLSFTEGGIDKGISKLKQINDEANQLGANAAKAAEGYTKIASAAKDTPLEGIGANQFYKGLQTAAIASNANAQRQDLVNLAGAQMVQKGVLSQEEIRQQMAENLQGVNVSAVLARSMNVDVPKLNKMIEQSLVTSDVLPKFGQQLQAELAIPAEEASKSAQASFNRLDNSIMQVQATVGKGILPVQAFGAEAIAKTLGAVNSNANTLMSSITALSIMLGVTLVKALYAVVSQFVMLPSLSVMASNAFRAMGSSIGTAAASIGTFALRFTLLTVAIMAAAEAMSVFQDQSGQLRTSTDTAKKSLDALQEKLRGKADVDVSRDIMSFNQQKKNAAYDQYVQNEKNPFLQGWARFNQALSNTTGQLDLGMQWQRFKQNKDEKDKTRAIEELQNLTPTGLRESRDLRNSSSMATLRQVEKQLEDNQLRQRALRSTNPDDIQGLNVLKQQEEALRKGSESLLEKKATAQKNTAVFIESLKSHIEELDKDPKFIKKVEELKKLLKEAEQEQQNFNRTFDSSATRLERFAKAWDSTIARMKDASAELQNQESLANTAINNAQSSGQLTPGQAQFGKTTASQDRMRADAAQTKAKIAELESQLQKLDATKVLAQYNLSNAGQQELTLQAGKAPEGSQERKVFESAAQLKELQQQANRMDSELSASVAQVSEELYNANKSIADYYRGIQRQIEDINSTIKSREIEIKSLALKDRLNKALNGMQSSFVDGLLGALFESLDVANKQAQNAADAIREKTANLRNVQDTTLQGQDLSRGLPMGGSSGGAIASGLYTAPQSRNGGSAEYHIDTKFSKSLSMDMRVAMMDAIANAYEAEGRKVEFSNPAVAGAVYNPSDPNRKDLLRRAQEAHSHSQYNDWESVDYYIPKKSEDRFGKSVEGAQIMLPTVPGGKVEYGSGGGYGNYALIYDSKGNLIAKTGHGDEGRSLPQSRSFGSISSGSQVKQGVSMGGIGSVAGFDGNRINKSVQILMSEGKLSPQGAAMLTGSFMQESGGAGWEKADNGTHRGIMQWQKGVRDIGLPSSFEDQVRFAVKEGLQDRPDAIATMRDPKASVEQVQQAIRNLTRYGPGEEKSRFEYGGEILAQLQRGGGAISGVTPVDLSGIQGSLGNATGANNASIDQLTNAKNSNLQSTADLNLSKAFIDTTESANDRFKASRQAYETVMNNRRGLGISSIESKLQQDIEDTERTARDTIEEGQKRLKQYQTDLKKLDNAETVLKEAQTLKRITPEQFKSGSEQIAEARKKITESVQFDEKAIAQAEQNRKDVILDLRQKAAYEIAKREQVIQKQFDDQTLERLKLNADAAERMGDSIKAIGINEESQKFEIQSSIKPAILEQEEFGRQNKLSREQVEKLIANVKELADLRLEKVTYEARKLKEELEASSRQEVFNSITNLADAQIQSFQILGMDKFAKDIQREKSLAEERMRYASEMKRLNETQMLPDERKIAQSNLDRTFNLRIDNIKRQYSVLNDVISQNRGAFEGFFSGILSGTDSIGSAFTKMIQSIAGNLANLASQYLTDELLGIFTGKNRNANEKDTKGIFGGISPTKTYDSQGRELVIAASDAGVQFKGLTVQAGEAIVLAGQRFLETVGSGGFGMSQLNSNFQMTEFSGETLNIPSLDQITQTAIAPAQKTFDTAYSTLMEKSDAAGFSIANGAKIASDLLTSAGTGTADNLLGGLSHGLPGILQSIVGMFGGGGKKGGGGFLGILNSVLGVAGGIFGGGGAAIPDIASPVLNLVPNFAKGGFASDSRPFINGDLFKDGSNPIAQAVKREGNGAFVGVINKDEYILTPPETQMYFALGFDKIIKGKVPNFRNGGNAIGTGAASRFSSGQQISITVPVTVSDGSSVDPQKLGESIRGAVQNEIARQQRPGGQLY
jgi:tape measure domain-containing protein